jgi:hypothetical protein
MAGKIIFGNQPDNTPAFKTFGKVPFEIINNYPTFALAKSGWIGNNCRLTLRNPF